MVKTKVSAGVRPGVGGTEAAGVRPGVAFVVTTGESTGESIGVLTSSVVAVGSGADSVSSSPVSKSEPKESCVTTALVSVGDVSI